MQKWLVQGDNQGESRGVSYRAWAMTCPVADLLGDRIRVIAEDTERNDRRAVQAARRFIRGNDLACIVTFTAAGKFPTRSQALDAVASFLRKPQARRLLFGTTGHAPYLYVAEPHKGGGWHVHMAVKDRFIPFREAIALWSAHLHSLGYESGTHRFTVGDPDSGKRTHTARECARYLAKYLSKTFAADEGREQGARRFTRAQGFAHAGVVLTAATYDALRALLPSQPHRLFEFEPDWFGQPQGFWASG